MSDTKFCSDCGEVINANIWAIIAVSSQNKALNKRV
jgi:hypothetical protein